MNAADYTTAAEAIARSISHNEVAYADASCRLDLLVECDDNVESDGVAEFWGVDNGNDWRVHVRL